jgi:hypothetical protein
LACQLHRFVNLLAGELRVGHCARILALKLAQQRAETTSGDG